ncbi:MAG: glycosyltransferase family 2 protein [Anaerolineae bacterium]|nr:glycosyltransferase family 2 protein [Anaerolineae bacterium]
MKISIIIPAFNEEESIGHVLDRIPNMDDYEVIVVDGGSEDQTVAIAEANGARVIHESRRGYGRACATGLEKATGKIVVFMDADGADDPIQIPELMAPLSDDQADLVLGSRIAGRIDPGAMRWHQYFGNWLAAGLFRRLYNLPITDLSPFRAVNRDKLLSLKMHEMTYGWPTEMIAKAARQNWRIKEIPVNYFPRYGGQSKISGTIKGTILATYYILSTIFQYAR